MSHAHELVALMRRPCPAHPTADAKCVLGDGTPACVDCARAEAVADARPTIAADDPRHGSTRGFHAGCRLVCCRAAIARYEKAGRLARLNGGLSVSALGAQRRIQALMRLGWTSQDIADAAGYHHRNAIFRILKGQNGRPCTWLERATADRIAVTFERLSMRVPDPSPARARCAAMATRNGWAPPLAWTNIDAPDDAPTGTYQAPTTVAEREADDRAKREADLEHAVEHGHTLHRVRADLGIGPDTVNAWCRRNDRQDLYKALAANTPRETAGAA